MKSQPLFAAPNPSCYCSPSSSQINPYLELQRDVTGGKEGVGGRRVMEKQDLQAVLGRAGRLLPSRSRAKAAAMLLPLGLRWQIIHDCKTQSFLYKNPSPNG